MAFCSKCGAQLNEDDKICPSCGAVREEKSSGEKKSGSDFSSRAQEAFHSFNNTEDTTSRFEPADVEENRVMGILAYLSWLVLIPLLAAPKSPFARYHANILTIHQSIPINGKGVLTVSVDIVSEQTNISAMIQQVEQLASVSCVKIIAME